MENKKNKWITFAIICLTTGVITELPYMRWQLYEPLREFLGQNNTQFGMSASLFGLLSMILYIPGGWVADRFSHKILFTVSSIGCGLLGFWLAAAPGFTSVMIIHGLWSITNIGLFWPTMTKAIALLEDSQGQGKVFGYFEGVRGIFVVVMWLGLMQVFEHMGGMRMVIIVMSILAILSGILSFFFMPDNKDAEAASSGTILKDMGAALKYPVTWLCAGTILCVYSVYNASSYMQPYCQEVLGMTAVVAGYVGILRKDIIRLAAAPLSGWLSKKMRRKMCDLNWGIWDDACGYPGGVACIAVRRQFCSDDDYYYGGLFLCDLWYARHVLRNYWRSRNPSKNLRNCVRNCHVHRIFTRLF